MNRWNKWQTVIFWTALGAIIVSIVLAFSTKTIAEPFDAKRPIKVAQAIALCIWIFVPPVWFWYEYFFLYRVIPEAEKDKPEIEHYKHGVDVASKLWLALVTVLLGLYFGKDFSREPVPTPSCTPQSSVIQQNRLRS
jgi:H+/Cl- antiporter ClcA